MQEFASSYCFHAELLPVASLSFGSAFSREPDIPKDHLSMDLMVRFRWTCICIEL